ncbi:MAG: hypothetical protein L6U16_04375 [Porphyromonadaceae bacterium]|nr:MAG: hypothetical protein L6U16_04375 [Porphyromonadaceae bacterium]
MGEALQAVNLRRRCKSVEVVGNPEKVGNVPTGHRIICVHSDGDYVTTHDGDLYFRGSLFFTIAMPRCWKRTALSNFWW